MEHTEKLQQIYEIGSDDKAVLRTRQQKEYEERTAAAVPATEDPLYKAQIAGLKQVTAAINAMYEPRKVINYGQGQALKVVAAQRMGLNPCCTKDADRLLRGDCLTPIALAAVEREALRIHNSLADDVALVAQANASVQTLLAEYGLAAAA